MNSHGADASSTCPGRSLTCRVADWAALRIGGEELAGLRRQPGSVRGLQLSPSFLKHADAQTTVELAAVLKAMARYDRTADLYQNWGVVSGPKMYGRDATAWGIDRYKNEGAWGIPPHIIPHSTLHAASGTISQALGIHGPNFSVSGGPNACSEAILLAASMLIEGNLPGLWLVLSGYEREKIPEDPACAGLHCEAVALALSLNPTGDGPTLRIVLEPDVPLGLAEFSLSGFRSAVEGNAGGDWRLPEGGWVRFQAEDAIATDAVSQMSPNVSS